MKALVDLAADAFFEGYRVHARCQHQRIGEVTEVTKDKKGRTLLKGHRRGNKEKSWQSISPINIKVSVYPGDDDLCS